MTAMGPREARIQRLMARFVGGGFLAYLLVSAVEFAPTSTFVAAWFTPVAAVAAFLPGITIFAYSFVSEVRPRVLVALSVLTSVGYVGACALWLIAWNGVASGADRVTWLMSFGGLPSLAIVLVRPLWVGVIHLVICICASTIVTNLGRHGALGASTITEVIWGVAYSSIFLFAAAMIRRTGQTLDQTRATALRVTSATAAATARDVERARFDALVHDHVIATLLAAESGDADGRLAGQARFALSELDSLAAVGPHRPVTRDEAAARLRVSVSSVSEDVGVHLTRIGGADTDRGPSDYPAEVIAAVGEAIAEAVRNASRHAGPDAECVVVIELGPDSLQAAVIDDGRGFDIGAVPPERLGIEVSIRLRMDSIPGGGSRIRSEAGAGTTVQLWWRRS